MTYTYQGTGVDPSAPPPHRVAVARCGTDSGYYYHRRGSHTPPCEACRRAHAAAERAAYKRRKQAQH